MVDKGSISKPGMHIKAADDASLIALVEQGMGAAIWPYTSLAKYSGRVSIIPLIPKNSRTRGAVYIGTPIKETGLLLELLKTNVLSQAGQNLSHTG